MRHQAMTLLLRTSLLPPLQTARRLTHIAHSPLRAWRTSHTRQFSSTWPSLATASFTMKSENPDYKHFAAIPWCAAHLSEPNIVRETVTSRFLKPSGEDILFATTLNTPETITAFMALYKTPPPPPEGAPPRPIDELKCLITLGKKVGGFPDVCHGGIVMTILDEVLGLLFPANKGRGAIPETAYMTAYLNTTFSRPVVIPGTYLCRSRFDKIEGRKYFMTGTIEDAEGNVMAKADALYVEIKEKL